MSKENGYILLDTSIAEEFHKQALKTPEYPLDCGHMRNLKKELMDLCGVTELEALNILCKRNVQDYISKYTGRFEGREIKIKPYNGDIEVVFKITEEERDIFFGN